MKDLSEQEIKQTIISIYEDFKKEGIPVFKQVNTLSFIFMKDLVKFCILCEKKGVNALDFGEPYDSVWPFKAKILPLGINTI